MPAPTYRYSTRLDINGILREVFCEAACTGDAYDIFEAIYRIRPTNGVFRA